MILFCSPDVAATAGVSKVPARVQGIEPYLVCAEAEIGTGIVCIYPVIVTCSLNPELGAQSPVGKLKRRGFIGIVDHQAELVAPATFRRQSVKLVLAQNVAREAIGVGRSPSLE